MSSQDPWVNWKNATERRLQSMAAALKELVGRHGDTDRKVNAAFNELKGYLGQGNKQNLPFDAKTLDQVVGRVRLLEYWLQTYENEYTNVYVRPERAVSALVKDPKTRQTFISPLKETTKPFVITTTPSRIISPAGNSQAFGQFEIPIEENVRGDTEIFGLGLVSYTSPSFRIELNNTNTNTKLQNNPIHGMTLFGDLTSATGGGPQPFLFYESLFLQPGHWLQITFTDFSGSTNNIEVVAYARRFLGYDTRFMDRQQLINLFFSRLSYPFHLTSDNSIDLTTSTTAATTSNFTLDRSFDLEIGKSMARWSNTSTGADVGAPNAYSARHNLKVGKSGTPITDNATRTMALFGTSNFPIIWQEPLLLKRGSLLILESTNSISGTANRTLNATFAGRALPYMPAPDQLMVGQTVGADDLVPFAGRHDQNVPVYPVEG